MARKYQPKQRHEPMRLRPPEQEGPPDIAESLFSRLPQLARTLIEDSHDMSVKDNRRFANNPDAVREHDQMWHQWGIITHTKMFEHYHREATPQYLEQWGVTEQVNEAMAEQIDGRTKAELFRIFIIIHDLGKFTNRRIVKPRGRRPYPLFTDHATASGKIVRGREFHRVAKKDYGLTDAQIEYIATLADLHFTMGDLRHTAKESEEGYTIAYVHSEDFLLHAGALMDKYPNFALEIGLSFLADSMAKTEIQLPATTDEQISEQTLSAKQELERRKISPRLIAAIKQWPVSREACAEYLKLWAHRQ